MKNGAISIRIDYKKSSGAANQHAHNSRKVTPSYADSSRISDNVTLCQSDEKLSDIARDIEQFCKSKNGRKWQKNSNHFIDGIITFSRGAKIDNKPELDICARNFISKMIDGNSLRKDSLVQLIRHEDESRTHFHFMLMNQQENGRSARRSFDRSALKKLQDLGGEAFSSMGITRGISKVDRLKEDPSANVIHRSVRQLHEDLPREVANLENVLLEQKTAIEKNKRYLANTKNKISNIENEGKSEFQKLQKLQKRVEKYENRIENQQKEMAKNQEELAAILKINDTSKTKSYVKNVQVGIKKEKINVQKFAGIATFSHDIEVPKLKKMNISLTSEVRRNETNFAKVINKKIHKIKILKNENSDLRKLVVEFGKEVGVEKTNEILRQFKKEGSEPEPQEKATTATTPGGLKKYLEKSAEAEKEASPDLAM